MSRHAAQAPGSRDGDRAATAPVRLVEVARAAGVSSMTVSRALRHPERVAPATLQSVRRAITRLGYLPDGGAAALATRRSRVVGAIVPTLMNSVYASTVHGLAATLRAAGYELMLGDSGYDRDVEAALVRSFLGRRVDALVLTGVEHGDATRTLLARHPVPVVEIWDSTRTPIDMLVGFSNVAAGRAAGRWFAAQGRRRWGFLGSPPEREARSGKRLAGFRQVARSAGLPPPETAFVDDGMSASAGRDAVALMLGRVPELDALFCANDALAVAALRAAHEAGFKVPARLAVLGFGDFDIAAVVQPALTTIAIPGTAIGTAAGDCLLRSLSGSPSHVAKQNLGFRIVRRDSA